MGFSPKPFSRLGAPLLDAGKVAGVGRKYLIDRGWRDEWIEAERFRWLDGDEVLARWSRVEDEANGDCAEGDRVKVVGAVLLPYPNDAAYGVARVFYTGPASTDDAPKFLTPTGKPLLPLITAKVSTDSKVPLLLIESPFKAAIAARKGLHGIGVNGCSGCHVKGARLPNKPTAEDAKAWFRPELLPYLKPGRKVALLTDADCESNARVGAAQVDFLDAATACGCIAVFYPVPEGGIDDYLVDHTAKDFRRLKTFTLDTARVAELRRFAGKTKEAYRIAEYVEPVSEMLTRKVKPIEYLFKGLVARGACSLLAGPPKGFKTTFAIWLALVGVGAV